MIQEAAASEELAKIDEKIVEPGNDVDNEQVLKTICQTIVLGDDKATEQELEVLEEFNASDPVLLLNGSSSGQVEE